jgi:hypothetical protein
LRRSDVRDWSSARAADNGGERSRGSRRRFSTDLGQPFATWSLAKLADYLRGGEYKRAFDRRGPCRAVEAGQLGEHQRFFACRSADWSDCRKASLV